MLTPRKMNMYNIELMLVMFGETIKVNILYFK